MKTAIFLIALLCSLFSMKEGIAQSQIRGQLKDHKGKTINSATITLKNGEGKIIAFTRTDEKGSYQLKAPAGQTAGLTLELSSLGYKREVLSVTDLNKNYDAILTESSIALPTVVINNRPRLRVDGDTLNYKLADFSNRQDRVLGDVLKKMPGIEVASDGKISYNGKNISNFYIDGDNLLDDKYNIATKSIPKDAVDKVQVIQNDQPIKMLRNKINSDDVALNITIKDEAKLKLIGQASLGAGLPNRFDENINGMMFNKKYKGINYLKGNNIGNDPAREIVSHNFTELQDRLSNGKPATLLSTGAAGVPDLPQNRYLFNRAGLLNVNNLFNLKKDIQLKTNLYYLLDRQQRDYDKFTEYTLPSGNVSFTENQHNVSKPNQFRAQASLNINREKSYLNNTFISNYKPMKYEVGLSSNGIPFGQQLQQRPFEVSNEFSYLNTLKNGNIYNLYSYLSYSSQPEKLQVNAGLNADQLNNGVPYSALIQQSNTPAYFANTYLSFKKVLSGIVQTYKTGFSFQAQELTSYLNTIQQDAQTQPASLNALNNLNWKRSNLYTEGLYEYETEDEKLKASLSVPLSYQYIHYRDPGYALNEKMNRLFVSPGLRLKYQTGIENYLQLSYTLKNELGTMDDIYRGAILKNYRSLYANNAPLSEQKNHTAALNFNYRKAITMFFFNLQASYSRINLNTISSSTLTNNLQERIVLPYDNNISAYNLDGNISKYWFALRTTFSMGLSWLQSMNNQFQNNELLPYTATNSGIKAGFQSKISSNTNLNYSINYNQMESKSSANKEEPIRYKQIRQQAELSFMPFNDLFLNLSAEHLYTKQSGQNRLSYLFSDLSARYKLNKINTDFEFGISNLGNIKTYRAVYVSSNAFTSGTYEIPGRIAMLKATLTF
ncbi:TonB-dependent receptor [Pedobacter caeni]|uniref:Carboxypeptidase regulatory-like domain-containing protein n=1 Tax=Pedobacter caeni TaxID=288992 RepID=A0A1M5HCL6_9SPHI|nr:hypothetical protein [Pedobacter caeni]SHG13542.1 hypothetical protein SAMN04488522_104601 [Pedobacter caeni]